MSRLKLALLMVLLASPAAAQDSPVATDVTSADIQAFINALPRDRVSDRPIRVVDVTGDYRVGVYGVFRPREIPAAPTSTRSTPPRFITWSRVSPRWSRAGRSDRPGRRSAAAARGAQASTAGSRGASPRETS